MQLSFLRSSFVMIIILAIMFSFSSCNTDNKKTESINPEVKAFIDKIEEYIADIENVDSSEALDSIGNVFASYMISWTSNNQDLVNNLTEEEEKAMEDVTNRFSTKVEQLSEKYPIGVITHEEGEMPVEEFHNLMEETIEKFNDVKTKDEYIQVGKESQEKHHIIFRGYPDNVLFDIYNVEKIARIKEKLDSASLSAAKRVGFE